MNLSKLKTRVNSTEGMKRRIVAFHNMHVTPDIATAGKIWYSNAYAKALYLSKCYAISLDTAAGVLSALSPAVSWTANQVDAENLIRAYVEGTDTDSVTVSTYGPNKRKALAILTEHTEATEERRFPDIKRFFKRDTKTRSFFLNIVQPHGTIAVTVDRHAIAVALGTTSPDASKLSITAKRYRSISEAYQLANKALGYHVPCDLQAVVWLAYRSLHVAPHVYAAEAPF